LHLRLFNITAKDLFGTTSSRAAHYEGVMA